MVPNFMIVQFPLTVVFLALSIILHAGYTGAVSTRYLREVTSEALTVAAIVWRIYRTNMRSNHTNGNLVPVVTAILESGLIYSLTVVIALACLAANELNGLLVVVDTIPPIVVSLMSLMSSRC